MTEPMLTVDKATVCFPGAGAPAVQDASLTIDTGEAFGVIGESGSGKSTLARAIVGLQPLNSGSVHPDPTLNPIAQFVFQDSAGALDPRKPAWWSVTEPLAIGGIGKKERRDQAGLLFSRVGLDSLLLNAFPHAMSGGQRQRLAIARALSVSPKLLVLDEPTSALDVSVQALVLNELLKLSLAGVSILLISHDLPVVAYLCTRIAVMKDGQIVETGSRQQVLESPQHAYTQSLIAAAR